MKWNSAKGVPRKAPNLVFMICKAALALFLCLFLISTAIYTVEFVSTNGGEPTEAELVSWCESSYLERSYADLFETLTLYDLYGERFALYWEAVRGYQAYTGYIQWDKAAALGIEGAREKAEAFLQSLQELSDAPAFSKNAAPLNELLETAKTTAIR